MDAKTFDALQRQIAEDLKSSPDKKLKVVVVNRALDVAQLIEVPVISDVKLSEVRRPDDLFKLLRGTGYIIVYADRDKV